MFNHPIWSNISLLLTFDPNFGIVLAHNRSLQVSSLEKMTSIIDSTQLAVLNHNALVLSKKLNDSKFVALQSDYGQSRFPRNIKADLLTSKINFTKFDCEMGCSFYNARIPATVNEISIAKDLVAPDDFFWIATTAKYDPFRVFLKYVKQPIFPEKKLCVRIHFFIWLATLLLTLNIWEKSTNILMKSVGIIIFYTISMLMLQFHLDIA